jgi:putative acetyltransferase
VERALGELRASSLPRLLLHAEKPSDVGAIETVTRAAFQHQPHSRQTEWALVAKLREAGALTLSLVAQVKAELVGHISFSPVNISGGATGWYCLAPLSVVPEFQSQGVGTELVWQGLRNLRQRGAAGCVVLGEPAYYGRFGFRSTPVLRLDQAPPGCFLVRPFERVVPLGEVRLHAAFDLIETSDWTFP